MQAYCVKCNRDKGKGEWKPVEIEDMTEEVLDTKKGLKKIARGKCPVCGSKVTKIIGKG